MQAAPEIGIHENGKESSVRVRDLVTAGRERLLGPEFQRAEKTGTEITGARSILQTDVAPLSTADSGYHQC